AFPMRELPGTFEIEHTEKDLGVLDELAAGLTRAFPALGNAPVLKGCAGLPTFTPDGQYLLGAVPAIEGLHVAAGCNAIGIAGAPRERGVLGGVGGGGRDRGGRGEPVPHAIRQPLRRSAASRRRLPVDLRELLLPGPRRLLGAVKVAGIDGVPGMMGRCTW